jgi:hypothetical protein
MHEIAVNVIVHYKACASVVFLYLRGALDTQYAIELWVRVLGPHYMEASYPAKRVEKRMRSKA